MDLEQVRAHATGFMAGAIQRENAEDIDAFGKLNPDWEGC